MICERCHGIGKLTCRLAGAPYVYPRLPCNACQGSGIASCCDAAGSAQPEPDKREDGDGNNG